MDMEKVFQQTVINMKEIGLMIKDMDLDNIYGMTKMFIKENGRIIKEMV